MKIIKENDSFTISELSFEDLQELMYGMSVSIDEGYSEKGDEIYKILHRAVNPDYYKE